MAPQTIYIFAMKRSERVRVSAVEEEEEKERESLQKKDRIHHPTTEKPFILQIYTHGRVASVGVLDFSIQRTFFSFFLLLMFCHF